MIDAPNPGSPANVDANVDFKAYQEKKSDQYVKMNKAIVERTRAIAEQDGVEVPMTTEVCSI